MLCQHYCVKCIALAFAYVLFRFPHFCVLVSGLSYYIKHDRHSFTVYLLCGQTTTCKFFSQTIQSRHSYPSIMAAVSVMGIPPKQI